MILNLRIDHANRVDPLAVRPGERPLAIDCVRQLLTDPDKRRAHDSVVAELFPNTPDAGGPLEAERAIAVVRAGPGELRDDELPRVLLSSLAVADLTRLADELLPDWWLDEMDAGGGRLEGNLGLDLRPASAGNTRPHPGKDFELTPALASRSDAGVPDLGSQGTGAMLEQTGPAVWVVEFAGADGVAARRAIASAAFGDAESPFTLRLHRVGDRRAELEMAPPPLRADVTVPAWFRTGEERVFVLRVPDEARVLGLAPVDVRPSTRSDPCEPLAAGALDIQELQVRDAGGLPLLWMRSGISPRVHRHQSLR